MKLVDIFISLFILNGIYLTAYAVITPGDQIAEAALGGMFLGLGIGYFAFLRKSIKNLTRDD